MSDLIIFNWSVENFSMCLRKQGSSIDSPEFYIDKESNIKGILKLYPFGINYYTYIGACLTISKGSFDFKAEEYCKLSIISSSKSVMDIVQHSWNDIKDKKVYAPRSDIYKNKKAFLPNDTLTIKCEIKIVNCDSFISKIYQCKTNIGFKHYKFEYPIKFDTSYGIDGINLSNDYSKTISFNKQLKDSENIFDIFTVIECVKSVEKNLFEVNLSIKDKINCFATISILLKDCNSDCCLAFEEISENSKGLLKITFTLNDDQILSIKNHSSLIICDLKIPDGSAINVLEIQKHSNYTLKKPSFPFTQKMYTDKEFCDVVLQVGNNKFEANKCLLAAASPIFKAMFKSGMEESKSNVVKITDIEATIIDKMLEVLYTDTLEHLQFDVVIKLYVAADKYQILELKERCIAYIVNNLTIENICEVLELAEFHNDPSMVNVAHNFIYYQHKELFSTSAWKNLIELQPKITAKVMVYIFERYYI